MSRFAAAVALTTATALGLVGLVASPSAATGTAAPTTCEAAVGSATAFVPVLQIDLPERANWFETTPPYTLDRTDEIGSAFDRVGYCLELDGPNGAQWVWAAMEPFTTEAKRLGLPTRPGEVVRRQVGLLEVESNVPGVTTGAGQTGYLEMWPNQYGTTASRQVPNASATTYDSDDSPHATYGYGSFQVHQIGGTRSSDQAPKPVLAVNTFTEPTDDLLSLGIGANPDGHPDWTFAENAARYTERRLTVFVRPSLVSLTASPSDRQLIPRDESGGAVVPVAGQVTDPRVTQVKLRVVGGGKKQTFTASGKRPFRFTPRITAGLHEYTFELTAKGPGIDRVVAHREGVLSGDVYLVQGQSNSVAAKYDGSAAGEESVYLRSFGSSTVDGTLSSADRSWHYATGDVTYQSGSVGQWAIRTGRRIVDTYKVPVAIVNGAHGGRPIDFFQRDDDAPNDPSTNYGRLRARLADAGLLDHVRGLLWYQGESDNDDAEVHTTGFAALLSDWRSDLGAAQPGGTRYYVHQVRTSPCNNSTTIALREAQRAMEDTLDVTVLSTSALDGHDGCHFAWQGGYRDLGDHDFAVIARDLYGGPAEGVAPPNPEKAVLADDGTQITVTLRSADRLTVEPGAEADFRLEGSTATVTSVTYQDGGRLLLGLSGPAEGATALSYVGHLRAGPSITNAVGAGLLAFSIPVS